MGETLRKKEFFICEQLWKLLARKPPNEPGRNSFKSLRFYLSNERERSARKQRFAEDPKQTFGDYFGPDVMVKSCNIISGGLPFLTELPVYLFIDDYSSPKITKDLQSNLNRLILQRTPLCFFKISTESPVSYSRQDLDAKNYVEGREFFLVNVGLRFLDADPNVKSEFIRDVFARRLRAVQNYPATELNDLVGQGPDESFNDTARQIRDGSKPDYWGETTICSLCSGDIHYVINLVGKMVNAVGGPVVIAAQDVIPKISAKSQNKAIREEAGLFLNNLRLLEHGDRLVAIVNAFGIVAHSHLKYKDSKNDDGTPPCQASRIEPYDELRLNAEAQGIYDELLRYSVFIEDMRGKSRRGKIVPRLYLRRFLIPHFNLTFSKRDSVELEAEEFSALLLNPVEFEKRHRLKEKQLEAIEEAPPELPTLFDEQKG